MNDDRIFPRPRLLFSASVAFLVLALPVCAGAAVEWRWDTDRDGQGFARWYQSFWLKDGVRVGIGHDGDDVHAISPVGEYPNSSDALVIFDLDSGDVPDNKMNTNINWDAIRGQTGDRELKAAAIVKAATDPHERWIRTFPTPSGEPRQRLTLYGHEAALPGLAEPVNLLIANHSAERLYFTAANGSYHIDLGASGAIYSTTGGPVEINNTIVDNGNDRSIAKLGEGLLTFGSGGQHNTYTGGFDLVEGIVEWTDSGNRTGGTLDGSPFGLGPLVMRDGTSIRSTTSGGRTLFVDLWLDGAVAIGSEDPNHSGSLNVTGTIDGATMGLLSDSAVTVHNQLTTNRGIGGAGQILCRDGAGVWNMRNQSEFLELRLLAGETHLYDAADGSRSGIAGDVYVGSGASFRADGDISGRLSVSPGGRLSPRHSDAQAGGGYLGIQSLDVSPDGVLSFFWDGAELANIRTIGPSGPGSIDGAELEIELGSQPRIGQRFALIENLGSHGVAGRFSRKGLTLEDGAYFTLASGNFGATFRIDYNVGDPANSIEIKVVDEPGASPYLAWLNEHPGIAAEEAGPLANPSGDGIPNALKFLLGLDPRTDSRALLPSPVIERDGEGAIMVLDIALNPGAAALEQIGWHVETSATLETGSWEPVPPEWLVAAGPDHARVRVAVADEERRFFRLRANFSIPAIHVGGADDGRIYLASTTPLIEVFPGYVIEDVRLNGLPFDGDAVTEQGLYELSVVALDPEGTESRFTSEFIVVNPELRAPHHTIPLELQLVRWLSSSPYVRPTPTADENFVIGQSHGWPADPEIPVHDLHALEISDFTVDAPKMKVVFSDGNHPVEHTGSWGLRGALNFLIGDEPEAAALRERAVFYVYPMVNPDGRSISSGRSNPEMLADGITDHNRVWHTDGLYSTIDAVKAALRADTGGTANYLLDFHSAGSSFFYSLASMTDRPLARAIAGRDPLILPRVSAGHEGMMRIWSMSQAGLSVSTAYTPEFAGAETATRSMEIGRNYGLAFHDLFTGKVVLDSLKTIEAALSPFEFGDYYIDEMLEVADAMLAADGAGDVFGVVERVYRFLELVDEFKEIMAFAEQVFELIESADGILETQEEGFGALFQNDIARRREKAMDVLHDPEGTVEILADTFDALLAAIIQYRKVEGSRPFPPVEVIEAAGSPVVYSVETQSEWDNGFSVNTAAAGDFLMLDENPVLAFDGNGGYVETTFFPGIAALGNRFTWEFWKQYRVFADDTGSSGSSGTSPRFYTQLEGSSGTLRTAIGNDWWSSATLDRPGEWYHIAFVYDNGEVRTYVNTKLVDTRAGVDFAGDNPNPFTVGRGFSNARWLDGLSRQHRIWNNALDGAQLRANMHRTLSGNEEGLVAYWRLNEGTGAVAFDQTVNARHGEVKGATWERYTIPGFRVSNPLIFTEISLINSSRIEWAASVGAPDASDAVAVYAGISDSSETFPTDWQQAVNGGPIPFMEVGEDATGKYLWVKQSIPRSQSAHPIRLHWLELRLD